MKRIILTFGLLSLALALTFCTHRGLTLSLPDPKHELEALPPGMNTEQYAHLVENEFLAVADHPLSTFSIDVDTASYSNVRRFLTNGQRPPIDAVRIEELINYFEYEYPAPNDDAPFSITTEVADAPWAPDHKLVRIGLQGRKIAPGKMPPRNLVFLIDVSGSMDASNKLPLLKDAFRLLVEQLGAQDRVSIVVYAGASGAVLPPTRGDRREEILEAIDDLSAGGSTNGGEGIELAYALAAKNLDPRAVNRVILATDGDFNVGITDAGSLVRLIERQRELGVYLSVLGFGMGNYKDSTLEALADKGNGNYAYIDTLEEAKKVLVTQCSATLVTIAKDTKIQIELNPVRVASYRLIGYENRRLADSDFNDDEKDAGDLGAGHSVTALYELVLAEREEAAAKVDPLKYQSGRDLTPMADSRELMTVKLRYKEPAENVSRRLVRVVEDRERAFEQASIDFRFASAVAAFGMLLRDSRWVGTMTIDDVNRIARRSVGRDPHGYRAELIELVARAKDEGVSRARASKD